MSTTVYLELTCKLHKQNMNLDGTVIAHPRLIHPTRAVLHMQSTLIWVSLADVSHQHQQAGTPRWIRLDKAHHAESLPR